MKRVHLIFGILMLVAFLLTGQYISGFATKRHKEYEI